jgi:hypothetical protein
MGEMMRIKLISFKDGWGCVGGGFEFDLRLRMLEVGWV